MSWPATLDDLPEWVRKTLAKHSGNRRPFVYTLEEFERAATHVEALATMIYLHDRYALDGRDPNTYTNILWCFGLHDRPWRERDVFGMIRYMSLEGMKRKTNVDSYVGEMNR